MTLLAVFLMGCNKGSNNGNSQVQVEKREGIVYVLGTDDKYTGKIITYHENGNKMEEGNFLDGIQEGLYTTWFINGMKENELTFKDGKPIEGSRKIWDKLGQRVNKQGFPLKSSKIDT